jgi:hypothetical protein
MNVTARIIYLNDDVTSVMSGLHMDASDISKRFGPDFGMNLGAFEALLDAIQRKVNKDARLPQTKKLNWKKLPPAPTGQTFSQVYLQKSVNELIAAIDWVMSHSPY